MNPTVDFKSAIKDDIVYFKVKQYFIYKQSIKQMGVPSSGYCFKLDVHS